MWGKSKTKTLRYIQTIGVGSPHGGARVAHNVSNGPASPQWPDTSNELTLNLNKSEHIFRRGNPNTNQTYSVYMIK